MGDVMNVLLSEDLEELRQAKVLLENPGFAAKLTNVVGLPLEKGLEMLPAKWALKIGGVTQTVLQKSAEAAIFTMKDEPGRASSELWHKVGAAVSGGIGGFFGMAALPLELTVSTTIMLRSIADIARSHGESFEDANTKLACLSVFAFGGRKKSDDALESSYYAVRGLLAKTLSDAAEHLASRAISEPSAPVLVRFFAVVSERFGIQISEKFAAQAVPVVGAASGALINALFIDHFQDMARGHFMVRRLERKYGEVVVRECYAGLSSR